MIAPQALRKLATHLSSLAFGHSSKTAQDRALARRLHATFEKDLELADVHGLQFYVRAGTVTVYGTIKNSLDHDLIVSLVRQVPGVKGVQTNLQVIDPWFLESPNPA